MQGTVPPVEAQGNPVSVATPVPQPFLRLEFWIRGDEASGPSFVQYYVRDAGPVALQTGPDAWAWVRAGRLRPLFDRVAAKVTPFTRPRITRITIAGASVKGAASYARLFALHGKAQSFPNEPDWKPIRIETARPGPWSTDATTLEYSPSKKVLRRGSEFVDVPTELAVRLEAGRSLDASDGRSFPWALLVGGIGTATMIVPGTLLYRRRDPR